MDRESYDPILWRSPKAPYNCDICNQSLLRFYKGHFFSRGGNIESVDVCPLCGWCLHENNWVDWEFDKAEAAFLVECHVDDSAIGLSELGSHLRRRKDDVYALSPRRFEMLVADVFRALGFRTVLTASTRDGGVDVFLLHHETAERIAIVECKRYAADRKVGIQTIRYLVGAAIEWGVRSAYLVTSSSFAGGVRSRLPAFRGVSVELIALDDLVSLLGVYNTKLPPLGRLTADDRQQIAISSTPELFAQYYGGPTGPGREARISERAHGLYRARLPHQRSALDDWCEAERLIDGEDPEKHGAWLLR